MLRYSAAHVDRLPDHTPQPRRPLWPLLDINDCHLLPLRLLLIGGISDILPIWQTLCLRFSKALNLSFTRLRIWNRLAYSPMARFKVPWRVRMECGRGGGDLRIQSICLDPCVGRCFCVVENHQASDFGVHPTQLLCIIPVPIVRWVLVGIAFGLSGYFLFANVYPVLAAVSANPPNKFRCTAVLFWRSVFPGAPGHSWTDHSALHI